MLPVSREHIRASKLALAAMLGVALVLGLSLSNVSDAQEPEVDESLSSSEPYAAASTEEAYTDDPDADGSALTGPDIVEICFFEVLGDDPHLSTSSRLGEVSAHGGWKDLSPGVCPTRADVTTMLYAKKCVGIFCWWSWLSSPTRTVRSGGASGKRATARHECVSEATTRFRSDVTVSIPGFSDTPNWKRSKADLSCHPWD